MMTPTKAELIHAARIEKARRNFWYYCHLRSPDFYSRDRDYLIDTCNTMQDFYENTDEEFLIIAEPPRHGKSRTGINLADWVFGKYPKDKVISGSYNETLSTAFSKSVRNTINEKAGDNRLVYHDIFPDTQIKYGDAAANLWGLEGTGTNSYLATSPSGTVTGFGGDLIIIDDIIKNEYEARNEAVKESQWKWFCFAGDTMISTAAGSVAISDIAVGDSVLTFNHFQCIIEEAKVVRAESKQSPIYRLEFENGRIVEVTGNHRFYTTIGYKSIEEVLLAMRVSVKEGETILLSDLQKQSADRTITKGSVSELRDRDEHGAREQTEEVLFYGMQTTIPSEKLCVSVREVASSKGKVKKGRLLCKVWENRKSSRTSYRSRYEKQQDGKPNGSLPIVPYKISQISKIQGNDTRRVYDIEVEKNHNFFANGMLAHNCDTMLSRREGKRKVIVIMTRWATDDLAGKLIEDCKRRGKKYRVLTYKAWDGQRMLCDDILTKAQYDGIINSDTSADIVRANYDQEPVDIVGRLYTTIKEYDKLPDNIRSTEAYFDTADQGEDYLCGLIYDEADCNAYTKHVMYTQAPMEQTEDEAARLLTVFDVNTCRIESNNGGRGWGRNVKRIAQEKYGNTKTRFIFFTQSKNKESRILTGSTGVMNRVHFPCGWQASFPEYARDMFRYQRIGKNAHDDAQDATTGVYEYLPKKQKESSGNYVW